MSENPVLKKFLEMTGAPAPRGIVHVGAHLGQEIREYKDYEPETLVWIEADPRLYQEMQDHLAQWNLPGTSQWCLNTLISDVHGEDHNFYIAKNDGQASSMFVSTDLLKERYPLGAPTGEILSLETRRLDRVLENLELSPSGIDYLVIDTQGAELKCLGGLGGFINNLRFIRAEASTVPLYDGGAQLNEIDAFLEPRGFLRIKSDPPAEHGDVLYVRVDRRDVDGAVTESTSDHEMRAAANEIIANLNDGDGVQESELLDLLRDYRDILAKPDSRLACAIMARIAFDDGYKDAFLGYLELLGWRPNKSPN